MCGVVEVVDVKNGDVVAAVDFAVVCVVGIVISGVEVVVGWRK